MVRLRTFDTCIPDDGVDQFILIEGNEQTMAYNPDHDRFNTLYTRNEYPTSRKLTVIFRNNSIHDVDTSWFASIYILNKREVDLYVDNNNVYNTTTRFDVLKVENFGISYMRNNTFDYCDHVGFSYLSVENMKEAYIENLNFTAHPNSYLKGGNSIIRLLMAEGGLANINNMIVEGNGMKSVELIHNPGNMKEVTITNSVFKNAVFDSDTVFINSGYVGSFNLDNIQFLNMKYSQSLYTNSYILSIPTIDLSNNQNSTIKNVTAEDSSISFLAFHKFVGSTTASSYFTISDVSISNNVYTSYSDVFDVKEFEYSNDGYLVIENLLFKNITFNLLGSAMKFSQHMKNAIIVDSLMIKNSSGAQVVTNAVDRSLQDFKVKVKFTNFTASDNESKFSTLIRVQFGSEIDI
jgi:hypothetical protein